MTPWRHEAFVDHLRGLSVAAGEKYFAQFRQRLKRLGIGAVHGFTFPNRLLVELQPIARKRTKGHGGKTPVAHRERFRPPLSWLKIPERGRTIFPQFNFLRKPSSRQALHCDKS
jgi:hypothetical protein